MQRNRWFHAVCRGFSRVQLDTKFEKTGNFVKYDFNAPEDIPKDMHGTFDLIVVDPPFITREVSGQSLQ